MRSHTGGEDDLSRNNDIVDRMARATIDDTVREVVAPAEDELFEGCPLRLMGAPVAQSLLLNWMRGNLGTLDRAVVDKHLMKAMAELCKTRNVTLTKQTIQRSPMIRAERMSLQITHVDTETTE